MAKASIWMRRRRRASQAIQPMVMHRKHRTRLLRRPVRPQRMIASLPIEATRARFQTRPSNWLLQLGRLGVIVPVLGGATVRFTMAEAPSLSGKFFNDFRPGENDLFEDDLLCTRPHNGGV